MARLNATELALMQSPARKLSQRHIELRTFQRLLRRAEIDLAGATILDAGCGNGFGLELLAGAFRPRRLVGFDLMPEQIDRAKKRGLAAEIHLGDITKIEHPEATFDAVFVFGILHHVPAWRAALVELSRVLKPGGALLVEELHGTTVDFSDRFLGTSHPAAARFDWTQFRGALDNAGLDVIGEAALLLSAVKSFLAVRR